LQPDTSIIKLDINLIIPNKYQPRKVFNEKELDSLAESIKNYGILNPILVRKKENKYEIIAGERRYRAAKKVGLQEVPVIVKTVEEQLMAELALIENIQRQSLSPIEEAKTYKEIMQIGNYTQVSLAEKLGKSQAAIANKIRLLALPEEVQDALAHKKISERHARSLLTVEDKERQLNILDKIMTEKLTVKETDQIINEKEITEEEINKAISDIMKSLNIEDDSYEETSIIKKELKKEEKEDDNMNNGNFFPNFDNNNISNNNTSLNMMNMQSMNQGVSEPVQEMVMPTNTYIQEPQTNFNQPSPFDFGQQLPNQEPQAIPSFTQYNPNPMENNNFGINNEFNPINNIQSTDNNIIAPEPVLNNEIPSYNPQEITFGPTAPVDFGMQQNVVETPTMPMTDTPLFNPDVIIPNETKPTNSFVPFTPTNEMNSFQEPQYNQVMETPSFEVPVTNPEPVIAPPVDKLSELQNLLNANGYNYKLFSNETDNCIIIEIPKN